MPFDGTVRQVVLGAYLVAAAATAASASAATIDFPIVSGASPGRRTRGVALLEQPRLEASHTGAQLQDLVP